MNACILCTPTYVKKMKRLPLWFQFNLEEVLQCLQGYITLDENLNYLF